MYASDFRAQARMALKGNWGKAILTYFLASLFGVSTVLAGWNNSGGGGATSGGNDSGSGYHPGYGFSEEELMGVVVILLIVLAVAFVIGIAFSLLRGVIQLGYAKFNLNLIDGKDAGVGNLFSQFKRFGSAFLMNFLVGLFTFLWSLLFVIPGIIKQFSYSMSAFVMLENPHLSACEAITESRRLMNGNKWRLYCLYLSFIGWELLTVLPLIVSLVFIGVSVGYYRYSYDESAVILILVALLCLLGAFALCFVGQLFLIPYQNASFAVFYRRICNEKNYSLNGADPSSGGYAAPQPGQQPPVYDPADPPQYPQQISSGTPGDQVFPTAPIAPNSSRMM